MFDTMESLFRFAREAGPAELRQRLEQWSRLAGRETFAGRIAQEIVTRAAVAESIPDVYQGYRELVRDAIAVFLSRVDCRRLIDTVVDLMALGEEASAEAVLLETARHFPTLHKLGQMMARNPHIDPVVKEHLTCLENEGPVQASRQLLERLEGLLGMEASLSTMSLDGEVLAEASVAAVVSFRSSLDNSAITGVCKILKPGITEHLGEELAVLKEVAAFFEQKRERYNLADLDVRAIFANLEQTMRKEIDLAAERKHLVEAADFYSSMQGVRIPRACPTCSPEVTCMEYLEGDKITDIDATPPLREKIAQRLFRILVCQPLFSRRKYAIFHGDPHAGNILIMKDPGPTSSQIGLVDWSLAGRLSLAERIGMNRLIQAMLKNNGAEMARNIVRLANQRGVVGARRLSRLQEHIETFLSKSGRTHHSLIGTVCGLLEALSYRGIVFPANLMLFRKAFFTLEGVVFDICPDFDFDAQMQIYLLERFAEEMPVRLWNMMFPLMDRAESYETLISNTELQSLLFSQSSALLASNMQLCWQPFLWWSGLWKQQAA